MTWERFPPKGTQSPGVYKIVKWRGKETWFWLRFFFNPLLNPKKAGGGPPKGGGPNPTGSKPLGDSKTQTVGITPRGATFKTGSYKNHFLVGGYPFFIPQIYVWQQPSYIFPPKHQGNPHFYGNIILHRGHQRGIAPLTTHVME